MKSLSSLFFLILVTQTHLFASNNFEVREVSYTCSGKECVLKTQFLNEKALPQYFWEKNDSGLSLNFAQTSTILKHGNYQLTGGVILSIGNAKVESMDVLNLKITGVKAIDVKEKLESSIYSLTWNSSKSIKKQRLSSLKPLKVSKPKPHSAKVEPIDVAGTKTVDTQKTKPLANNDSSVKVTKASSSEVNPSKNSLESFAKSIPNSRLDPAKVFGLKDLKQEMAVVKLANLYADKQKSKILTELTPGKVVIKLGNYKKLTKVKVSGNIGYVRTDFIKPTASLTPIDDEKLKKLALSIIEKKKSAPKSTITVDEKQTSEGVKVDSIKTAKPDSKTYSYSTFGRKDPFVPYEDEVEEGMNIDAVQVVGIIWEESSPIVIMEEVNGSGATYTLKENDPIQNGKVFKITPDEVTFELTEFGITRRFAMQLPVIQEGGN